MCVCVHTYVHWYRWKMEVYANVLTWLVCRAQESPALVFQH